MEGVTGENGSYRGDIKKTDKGKETRRKRWKKSRK